jgi:hypothetical protein
LIWQGKLKMTLTAKLLVATAALAVIPTALAGKFDACPDPAAAEKYVKACMQENPYNTREACEQRALERFCSGK